MGDIKDLADLIGDLLKRTKDRQQASELLALQTKVSDLHVTQVKLLTQRLQLETNNVNLKARVAVLEARVLELEPARAEAQELRAEVKALRDFLGPMLPPSGES